jgi:hypothetical protein
MAALIRGPKSIERILWGTGAMVAHPRPHLEAFVRDFRFSEELVDGGVVAQITDDDKRAILAENYARMHGLDLRARLAAVADDEFARRRGAEPAPPYSTTRVSALV